MPDGITLGISLILVLLLGGFVLTLLINILLVPLWKTPKDVIQEITDIMTLSKEDHLADLGSGDGRLLLQAHRYSMCRCTGYDISPIMHIIAKTKQYVQFPMSRGIVFEAEDIFKADLKNFTKVYCYLDEKSLEILRPKLEEFIKEGGEVYSYRYGVEGMGNEENIVLKNGVKLFMYK